MVLNAVLSSHSELVNVVITHTCKRLDLKSIGGVSLLRTFYARTDFTFNTYGNYTGCKCYHVINNDNVCGTCVNAFKKKRRKDGPIAF